MKNSFTIDNNFSDADAFYAALIDCHRHLTREESERFNARLIMILANQIGDVSVLEEALAAAALDPTTGADET